MTEIINRNNSYGKGWREYTQRERAHIRHTGKFAVAFKNWLNYKLFNPKTLMITDSSRIVLSEGKKLLDSIN